MNIDIEFIDLEIYRGDDTSFTFTVQDKYDRPIDFNGASLSMLIKPKRSVPYLLKEDNGITVIDNNIIVIFSHELTKDWEFKRADYDLQVVDSVGRYRTLVRGKISITRDITP